MELQKQVHIPQRSTQIALEALKWARLHRQVFWLSDGRRDMQRIAMLLHKSLSSIEEVIADLRRAGYISLRNERKVFVMNVALLKESFDMVVPQKEAFAHSFYERLFTDYPQTQSLFAETDMPRQEGSLMATLATVVAGVQRGDNLVPTLQRLGQKHKRYGAQSEYYAFVGASLLETFSQYLGPRFTPEMQEAWEEAYEIISTQMIEGANTFPN